MRTAIGRGDTTRALVQSVAAGLIPQLDEQAVVMAQEIHAGIPELSEELLTLTSSSCRANIWLICTMLDEDLDPAAPPPPGEALKYAREFVHLGLSIDNLIRTYRIGHASFWKWFLRHLTAEIDDPAALSHAVSLASEWCFRYVDALSSQMSSAYLCEREQWSRSSIARRTEEVRAILERRSTDAGEASRRLRYELSRRHVAFLVSSPEQQDGDCGALEELARAVRSELGAVDLLTVPMGAGLLACWVGFAGPAPDALEVRAGYGQRMDVAIGEPREGLDGFRRSHREALDARRVAGLAHRSFGITHYGNVALLSMLLNDLDAAAQFVERELMGLAEDSDAVRRLTSTLRVFFEEGSSFKRTSRRLGVHGNTVVYRVQRAAELLGHNIGERQLEVRVALQLVDVLRRSNEEPDRPMALAERRPTGRGRSGGRPRGPAPVGAGPAALSGA